MFVRVTLITSLGVIMGLAGEHIKDSVTLSSQTICASTGSTAKIPCSFTTQYTAIQYWEWYKVMNFENMQIVVRKNNQPSKVNKHWNNCVLTLNSVKESDSGIYNFRFRTWPGDWITASSGANLTVGDLQLKVDHKTVGQRKVKISCITVCSLSANTNYYWHRNGQYLKNSDSSIVLDSTNGNDEGSYYCGVRYNNHHSPEKCVLGPKCWGVTYTSERICALKNSSVDLPCSYNYPEGHTVTKSVWFIGQQTGAEPVDLEDNKEYHGRTQYIQSSQNDCSLTVNNVKDSDAHTYRFKFHTDSGDTYTGYPGVNLSVLELKVTVSNGYGSGKWLTCITTCTLGSEMSFIWYKNGQLVRTRNSGTQKVYHSTQAGSYSCAIKGREDLRSPAVCISGFHTEKSCWSVTYTPMSICTLIGSSVDIHSYYTFPNSQKVTKSVWFTGQQTGAELLDLKNNEEYHGRIEYIQSSLNDCSLRITNVKDSDAHIYRFIFYTDAGEEYTSKPGVTLSVTVLQVKVESSAMGQKTVTLRCVTTCSLPNNPTYIWYKNRKRVSHCMSSSCIITRTSGDYNCAVEGHESLISPPVYSPRTASAFIIPSGETVEGDLVTLICSSDANPPVLKYSWFKKRTDADTLLGTGQNYSIKNISSQHSGFYYCTAENPLGQINSNTVWLDVLYSPQNTSAIIFPSGDRVEGDSVALICSGNANPPVLNYTWFMRREAADSLVGTGQNYSINNIDHQHSGLYYCTALNKLGHNNSTTIHLDVLYAPKLLSVSVQMSGSWVTLVCKSDSNPTSSYTWYRRIENNVEQIKNGTNVTLDAGSDGLYYCMATNQHGSKNSTEWSLNSDNTSVIYVASRVSVVLLPVIIVAFLWVRRKKTLNRSHDSTTEMSFNERCNKQDSAAPLYDNISVLPNISHSTRAADSVDEDEVSYTSIQFPRSPAQQVLLHSNVQPAKAQSQQEDVEYAAVKFTRSRARMEENPIYSTIQHT